MAYFARIENGLVVAVHTVANAALDSDNEQSSGAQFLNTLYNLDANWIQTSYNGNIRKQYCGVGFSYNPEADVFVSPQPFPFWTLDDNHDWQAPVAMPVDDKFYTWSEDELNWIEVVND